VLIAVVAAAGVRLYSDWIMFEATHLPGAIQPQREALPTLATGGVPPSAAPADWTEIPSRDAFSFDRTDIAILEPKAPPAVPPGPKPFLFGTISLGKDRLAMVAPGKPGNRDYRSMKAGEVVDGWTIVEISDKSIVIESNLGRESVIMNDPSAQVQRDHTRTLATAAPSVISVAQPVAQPALATPAPVPSQQPAPGQGQPRRRVVQMTPFGPREIEEPQ
jgi:hypothetical protein